MKHLVFGQKLGSYASDQKVVSLIAGFLSKMFNSGTPTLAWVEHIFIKFQFHGLVIPFVFIVVFKFFLIKKNPDLSFLQNKKPIKIQLLLFFPIIFASQQINSSPSITILNSDTSVKWKNVQL